MAGAIRSTCLSRLKNMSLKSIPSFSEEASVLAVGKSPKVPFGPSISRVQELSFKDVFQSNFTTATTAVAPVSIFGALGFSSAFSHVFRCKGSFPTKVVQRSVFYSTASVAKRIRRSEKMQIKNKARKSKVKARMIKVFEALDELKNKPNMQAEEMVHIDKLIEKAHSTINKAVSAGVLHRNTGQRRKARLARRKRVVEVHHGLDTSTTSVVNFS
uniref:30S ribosomal protein S20 n=1 Tax=Rhizophora mucronata TaxID=61149 RepID=A0A2P2PMR7_RHIMU